MEVESESAAPQSPVKKNANDVVEAARVASMAEYLRLADRVTELERSVALLQSRKVAPVDVARLAADVEAKVLGEIVRRMKG
jgi:hypothetical protein